MRKAHHTHPIILMLLILCIGCKDEDIKTNIYHTEGVIHYRTDIEKFIIAVTIEGTIDSQNVYIPTSDISGFTDGQTVLFSGEVSSYNEDIGFFVGQEYYYINLTNIKVLE